MTTNPPKLCPHCGKPMPNECPHLSPASTGQTNIISKDETREADHRDIVLPRRTRMGGIITPQ